ncbi:MAG: hypothetical protein ACFFE4_00560 [Candidatus Thorarchaeota archaeon]
MFKVGDKVLWEYRHYLNSKSWTNIAKEGRILKIKGNRALVKLNNNKYAYYKPITELYLFD